MKLKFISLLSLALTCMSVFAAQPLFDSLCGSPETFAKWEGHKRAKFLPAGGPNGKSAVSIANNDPEKNIALNLILPVKEMKGRRIVLSAQVKAIDISTPKSAGHGIRMSLNTYLSTKKKWIFSQGKFPRSYASGWTEFVTVAYIPADADCTKVCIGLQNVTGTVLFADIKVELCEPQNPEDNLIPEPQILQKMLTFEAPQIKYLPTGGPDGTYAIEVSNTKKVYNHVWLNMPADKVRGHQVVFSGVAKAEDVSAEQHPDKRIRIMIIYETSEHRKKLTMAEFPRAGSFDWKEFEVGVMLPSDTINVSVVFGLLRVTGKVSFADLRFRTDD